MEFNFNQAITQLASYFSKLGMELEAYAADQFVDVTSGNLIYQYGFILQTDNGPVDVRRIKVLRRLIKNPTPMNRLVIGDRIFTDPVEMISYVNSVYS